MNSPPKKWLPSVHLNSRERGMHIITAPFSCPGLCVTISTPIEAVIIAYLHSEAFILYNVAAGV